MLVHPQQTARRRGSVTMWVVFAAGLFLAVFALVVDVSGMWSARQELLLSADAATLASAGKLIHDDMLLGDPAKTKAILKLSHDEAIAYGLANPVGGGPLILLSNEDNQPGGDIEFGWLEQPNAGKFQNLSAQALYPRHDSLLPSVNSVRVWAQRTRERGNPGGMRLGRIFGLSYADISARATAYLDRDIVGFKSMENKALPFAPLALLSDAATLGGLREEDLDRPEWQLPLRSWESQTVLPMLDPALGYGLDEYTFDPDSNAFYGVHEHGVRPDGLYEMEVLLPIGVATPDDPQPANGRLIKIGGKRVDWSIFWETYVRQMTNGLIAADFKDFGGQLLLREDNQKRLRLPLPSLGHVPEDEEEAAALYAALEALQESGEGRIWPLYQHVTEGTDGTGTAEISGFVAARLALVEVVSIPLDPTKPEGPSKAYIRLILQPCMLSTPYALTDATKRADHPHIANPYLAKVRLAE